MLIKLTETVGLRLASSGKEGSEWEIVIIEAGLSKNGKFYSESVLTEAAHLFDGAKIFAYEFKDANNSNDHLPDRSRSEVPQGFATNLVGWVESPTFKNGALVGKARITNESIKKLMKESFIAGRDLLGFSIDAEGDISDMIIDGRAVKRVDSIKLVNSLDVVTHPAAGGRLTRLVASLSFEGEPEMFEKLLKLIRESFPKWVEGFDTSATGDKAKVMLGEILEANALRAGKTLGGIAESDKKSFAEVARGVSTLNSVATLISESKGEEAANVMEKWAAFSGNMDTLWSYPVREAEGEDELTDEEKKKKEEEEKKKREAEEAAKEGKAKEAEHDEKSKLQAEMDKLKAKMTEITSESVVKESLALSDLPEMQKTRIRESFVGKEASKADVVKAISKEKDYAASLRESTMQAYGVTRDELTVTDSERDRYQLAMDGMIGGNDVLDKDGNRVRAFTGLHESYRQLSGFAGSPKDVADCIMREMHFAMPGSPGHEELFAKHHRQLKESMSSLRETLTLSSWAEVFGDSIRRQLIKEFEHPDFNQWRKIASNIVPLQDFRTNRRIRVGGFGTLDTVTELGTYQDLAEPGDEEVTYAAQKRGNTFSVSWESLVNDDLGKVRDIPRKLGIAAAQTLNIFVMRTNLSDNPTIFDGNSLIDSTHNNNGTTALSQASLVAAIKQMRKQTNLSSGLRLSIKPKFLVVPVDLEDTGWELIESAVKSVALDNATTPGVIRGKFGLELLVNDFHTTADLNDWFLIADPGRSPTIEIGFLGGRQEPEVFIQDQQNIGSVLTADKITYKIRHVYGGNILDFRSYAGGIVA